MDVASWSPAAASVNQRQQPQIKQQVAATISVAAGQSHPLTTASSSVVPKINSSSHGAKDNKEAGEVLMLGKHSKGCHCKRSGCLRKYCECFQANILCSESCKCMGCKKFKGSEERQALFHGDYANNMAYIQQAANATTTGAIGSSGYASAPVSKKRKSQELLLGSTAKDPSVHSLGHLQQTNLIRASIPSSSLSSMSVSRAGTAVGPSKLSYRSLFADIIQKQDLKELCSVLVVLSREAAKILAGRRSFVLIYPRTQ
ncbi:hypothetical protein E1A91_A05G026800v1 [Gossypium mustelinum]|uniref:CRC domain-containing protein n=1 Tax=Gossypium mustelinum TaxID=34275 RepID=A0A5D2Z0K8_GOSMU|nr:hypothetical protein E1A91_A05G026800v1 [Gossypium mustelinum]